jgi:hypothetical protein
MELGQIIATRTLTNNAGQLIFVHIGLPRRFDEDEGWYAPYQVIGIGDERVRFAGGVDAIQSIILALSMLRSYFIAINTSINNIQWDGQTDLGFSV